MDTSRCPCRTNGPVWSGNNTSVQAVWMQEVHNMLQRFVELTGATGLAGEFWPSTGFLALAVALAVGKNIGAAVGVYGFGRCDSCVKYDDCDGRNTSRKGLATEERLGLNGYHPFGIEAALRQ